MSTTPYRAGAFIAALLLLTALLTGGACAQTEPDLDRIDVAGVRLGMSADEAIAALKEFDPSYTITKRYLTGRGTAFGIEGKSMEDIFAPDRSTAYLDDLAAVKGTPHIVCPTATWCEKRLDDDEETVKVWFSRTPGQETVIAVQRSIAFHKEPHPAIISLKAAAATKYARASFERQDDWGDTTGWLFDAGKYRLSEEVAQKSPLAQVSGMPKTVLPGDGIGLNMVLLALDRNPQIADHLTVTLYDATALYHSVAQSTAAYDIQKQATNARQLDDSLKTAATPKF